MILTVNNKKFALKEAESFNKDVVVTAIGEVVILETDSDYTAKELVSKINKKKQLGESEYDLTAFTNIRIKNLNTGVV